MIKAALMVLIAAVSLCGRSPAATEPFLKKSVAQSGFAGTMPDAIVYFAATFQMPTVAEVVFHKDRTITIPKGTLTAPHALAYLTAHTRLKWEIVDGVLHIYEPSIVENERNFLSYRFAWFKVPESPGEFEYLLKNRLATEHTLPPHRKGVIGGAYSGVMPQDLGKTRCIAGEFREITARELLLKEAKPARLVVVMTYPDATDKFNENAWKFVGLNWFWRSIDAPPAPLPIDIPETHRKGRSQPTR